MKEIQEWNPYYIGASCSLYRPEQFTRGCYIMEAAGITQSVEQSGTDGRCGG